MIGGVDLVGLLFFVAVHLEMQRSINPGQRIRESVRYALNRMREHNMEYEAVTKDELVERLGRQCSPMEKREGYVIGPDVNGRLCHIATCFGISEARKLATKLNSKKG